MRTVRILGIAVLAAVLLSGLPLLLRRLNIPLDDYLALPRTLLIWPVAVAVLGLVLLIRQHEAIDYVIRHGRWTLPGGVQLESQAREAPASGVDNAGPGTVTLTPEQRHQLTEVFTSLQQQTSAAATEVEHAKQQIADAFRNAVLWEFRFLDLFYIPVTKQVLKWFSQFPSSREVYESMWKAVVADPHQRETILNVLLAHDVLSESGGRLQVTPKGRALLEFLGFQPQPISHPGGS